MSVVFALMRRGGSAVALHVVAALALGVLGALVTVVNAAFTPASPLALATANLHVFLALGMPISFGAGFAVVSDDFRYGQVDFLDALPASRVRRFGAAVGIALVPWTLSVVAIVAPRAFALWLAHGDGDAPWFGLVGLLTATSGAFLLTCLGFGLLFSWIGELGWPLWLTGLLFFVVRTELDRPYAALWPRSTGSIVDVVQTLPTTRWDVLAAWLGLFVLTTGASLAIFLGPGELLVRQGSRVGERARIAGYLLLYGVAFTSLVQSSSKLPEVFARKTPTEVVTAGENRVTFRADSEEGAAIAAVVDEVAERVQARLDAPARSFEVQMMGTSRLHDGEYESGRIRLSPYASVETLAHELTHAYAAELARYGLINTHEATRFFNEGLATYTEHQLYPPKPKPSNLSLLRDTGQASFDDLVHDSSRTARFDRNQVYALGEAFVAALVAEAGEGSPSCVLRKLRGEVTSDTDGVALWYALAEQCDFSLDAVIARYDASLDDGGAPPPDVRWHVETRAYGSVVVAVADGGFDVEHARFRDCRDADERHEFARYVDEGHVWIPEEALLGGCFDVQFEVKLDRGQATYLPWSTDHHLPP